MGSPCSALLVRRSMRLLHHDGADHILRVVVEQAVVRVCSGFRERYAETGARSAGDHRPGIYERGSVVRVAS